VPEVIFCYDGDLAGHKAAWRALENALPILRDGLSAKFLFLPDGEDPDSMVRKEGREAFESRLVNATPLSDFLFDNLLQEIDTSSMDGKAKLAKTARPLLAALPESIFRDLMYQRLSELVGVSDEKLKDVQATAQKASIQQQPTTRSRQHREIKTNALRDAIALLLQHPELAREITVPDYFATASIQGFSLLHALYETIISCPDISSSALLERWRDNKDFEIVQKLIQRNVFGTDEKTGQIAVFSDAIRSLNMKFRDARFEILENKLKQSGLDPAELEEYKSLLVR
jgi:DNA primase